MFTLVSCIYVEVTERRSPPVLHTLSSFERGSITTDAHLNVVTHFLWEGPVEPRHPRLVAAGVALDHIHHCPTAGLQEQVAIVVLPCRPVIPDSQ